MRKLAVILGVCLVTLPAGDCLAAGKADGAAVTGVVSDAHGIPQMGALVELLRSDASVVARGFTDDRGRYLLTAITPGKYQLRASAAFLLPVLKRNFRVQAGASLVANLNLIALFETANWLPAQTRNHGQANDDWKWTLRSTANRPLLRLVGQDSDEIALEEGQDSSSASPSTGSLRVPGAIHGSERTPLHRRNLGELTIMSGTGRFGEGGTGTLRFAASHEAAGLESSILARMTAPSVSASNAAVALATGLTRRDAFGGEGKAALAVETHPNLVTGGAAGLQAMRLATSEHFVAGDIVEIDAGSLLMAIRLLETQFTIAPYLRAKVHVSSTGTLEYGFARSRALQRSSDTLSIAPANDILLSHDGRGVLMPKETHQEIAYSEKVGGGVGRVAAYQDVFPLEAVDGVGVLAAADLEALPVIADTSTSTFRLTAPKHVARGVSASWARDLSPGVSLLVTGGVGGALEVGSNSQARSNFQQRSVPFAGARLHVTSKRLGTEFDGGYRWQPAVTVTQVDAFERSGREGYLSFSLRQQIGSGHCLHGLEGVIEATNLLRQGYQPMASADGRTIYLAQAPQVLQAGLAFTF